MTEAAVIPPGLHANWRALPADLDGGWRWPHFAAAELGCKCGRYCRGEYYHQPAFLDRLELLRARMDRALKVNSGRRCPLHNAAVGGAPASQHRLKIAVDISVAGWTPWERQRLLVAVHALGFGGIGYAINFLHLDSRPLKPSGRPAQWDYQKGGMAQWLALLN